MVEYERIQFITKSLFDAEPVCEMKRMIVSSRSVSDAKLQSMREENEFILVRNTNG